MKLAYSELTDKVYIVAANGKKEEITQNFIQVMLLWFHETSPEMKPGQKWERSLRSPSTGETQWNFTIEKPASITDKHQEHE